jgi:hypothetical protein
MLVRSARPKALRLALADSPSVRTRVTLSLYISVTLREWVGSLMTLLELRVVEH